MIYCVPFLASFALFVLSASPTVSFEDTGELIWAADCLGVTHPPGYPWLTMLGALFMRLPAGDLAFRMTLLSAACAAGTVTLAFASVRLLAHRLHVSSLLSGAVAALALAGSRTLWWQAGIADKYTLSLFLLALVLHLLLVAWLERSRARLSAAVFLLGLALSHHLHGLYLIPAALAAVAGLKANRRRALLLLFLLLIPLAGKAVVIAVRAKANPALNWTVPDRAERLFRYLAARQYRKIMFSTQGNREIAGRAIDQVALTPLREFGPSLAFAVPGLALLRGAPGILVGVLLVFTANIGLALSYNTPEIERYYLISFFVLAALAGLGAGRMARLSRIWAAAAVLSLFIPFLVNSRTSPRSSHYLAYDFAVNQIAPLPADAMLICEGDDQAFPLFYVHAVAKLRPDIAILPMPFACTPDGYARLKEHLNLFAFPIFVRDPGSHIPRIIRANERKRPAFYTPGCTGAGSEAHLVPYGIIFRAFADPARAAALNRAPARFPRLRLRGCVTARRYLDHVTLRAVSNYSFAQAFHGARALQTGDPETAAAHLREALRIPVSNEEVHAAALTHLGIAYSRTGRRREAEACFERAFARFPSFGPGLFAYAEFLLDFRMGDPRIPQLMSRALLFPRFLTEAQREKAARVLRNMP